MKKAMLVLLVVVVMGLVAAVVVPLFFVNSLVKAGVETVGPKVTKVEVRLESANLSLWSGQGELRGLRVGNPEGYKTPAAMQVNEMSLALAPRSVFSDKVVVKSMRLVGPEITFEGGLTGNNLKQILDNVQASTAALTGTNTAAQPAPDEGITKKIQIDEFVLSGAKLHVNSPLLQGKPLTLNLPEIRFENLGTGPEGITAGELTRRVLNEVLAKATPLIAESLGKVGGDLIGSAFGTGGDASKGAGSATGKAIQGLGELLKKKK